MAGVCFLALKSFGSLLNPCSFKDDVLKDDGHLQDEETRKDK